MKRGYLSLIPLYFVLNSNLYSQEVDPKLRTVNDYIEALKTWDLDKVKRLSTNDKEESLDDFNLTQNNPRIEPFCRLEKMIFNMDIEELVGVKNDNGEEYLVFLENELGNWKIRSIHKIYEFELQDLQDIFKY